MHEQLLRTLGLGPMPAAAVAAALGISQPTVSRLVQRAGDSVVVGGKGRSTRYGARRRILGVDSPIPVYVVDHLGGVRVLGQLQPVEPMGFLWTPTSPAASAASSMQWFADLPWFLNDVRPAGFLGRLLPRRHTELELPEDVRLWTGDQVLRFITRHGHDLVGAVIVGDEALRRHQQHRAVMVTDVDYPRLATDILAGGLPGSSAAGEQPKFLADRVDDDKHRAVLVKWSPPIDPNNAVSGRWADLLLAEHHAHEALRAAGVPAAHTRIVDVGGRRFLQSERFDRTDHGRRGLVSLASLDGEFVGSEHRSWSAATASLLKLKVIGADDHRLVRIAEGFGGVIGNSDMHFGNLSFFADGIDVQGLAPLYDMLPMRYAPVAGEVVARAVEIVAPTPKDADIAAVVFAAGAAFWRAILDDDRASEALREIARGHQGLIAGASAIAAR